MKTTIQSSTRWGTRRSSGTCLSVWSREPNPVWRSSLRSSMRIMGDRFCMQRLMWTATRALKSSTGGRGSSPANISNTVAFNKGHASSGVIPGRLNEFPRFCIASLECERPVPGDGPNELMGVAPTLPTDGHSDRSVLKDCFRSLVGSSCASRYAFSSFFARLK